MTLALGATADPLREQQRPVSVRPYESDVLPSAMQNRPQRRLAVLTNWRPSIWSPSFRDRMTSAPSVMSARRASAAEVVDGSGAPNATVTG